MPTFGSSRGRGGSVQDSQPSAVRGGHCVPRGAPHPSWPPSRSQEEANAELSQTIAEQYEKQEAARKAAEEAARVAREAQEAAAEAESQRQRIAAAVEARAFRLPPPDREGDRYLPLRECDAYPGMVFSQSARNVPGLPQSTRRWWYEPHREGGKRKKQNDSSRRRRKSRRSLKRRRSTKTNKK